MFLMELDNLYQILDINISATTSEIIDSYNKQITNFKDYINNGNILNDKDKHHIKILNIAKFVLTDENLRKQYNLINTPNDTPREYKEITKINIPLRKDSSIDNDNLSKRQFSRYSNDSSNHLLNDREFTNDNFYNIIN
tara:strand:- start:63 stop:479 length:417 start_codon:yes stop_codon:yes gene_type:complete